MEIAHIGRKATWEHCNEHEYKGHWRITAADRHILEMTARTIFSKIASPAPGKPPPLRCLPASWSRHSIPYPTLANSYIYVNSAGASCEIHEALSPYMPVRASGIGQQCGRVCVTTPLFFRDRIMTVRFKAEGVRKYSDKSDIGYMCCTRVVHSLRVTSSSS